MKHKSSIRGKTFYILTATDGTVAVQGKSVIVHGLSCFIHRAYLGKGLFSTDTWNITEVVSGNSITGGCKCKTQKHAVQIANDLITKYGIKETKRRISNAKRRKHKLEIPNNGT